MGSVQEGSANGGRPRLRANARATALFERQYQERARWDADLWPKKDAAAARRAATSLGNTIRDFERLFSAKETQTLAQAADILRGLAQDLDQVCALSRRSKTEHDETSLRNRHAAADATAAQRWADDAAMRSEAAELAAFVDQRDATESRVWVLARHAGCNYAEFLEDRLPPGQRLVDMLGRAGKAPDTIALRRRAAEYLLGLQAGQRELRRQYKDMWRVGIDDYEAWRAWRAEVLAAITPGKPR